MLVEDVEGAEHRNIWCAGHVVNLKVRGKRSPSPTRAVMAGILKPKARVSRTTGNLKEALGEHLF